MSDSSTAPDDATSISHEDRCVGSMLGLALGDALGARHEGGPLGATAWWILGLGKGDLLRWTDDTEMAIGLAESLADRKGLDADHLARRWAEGMNPWRGYGQGARRLLKRVLNGEDWRTANTAIFPEGSFGNGAAMRAAPIGLVYHRDLDALTRAAEAAASITHAHPLGIEGGVLIARAVALAMREPFEPRRFLDDLLAASRAPEYRTRLEWTRACLAAPPRPKEVRDNLGCSVLAHESAVTAVHAFLRHRDDFDAMMRFIIELGGDTDTIGAMAGGIFGAARGVSALPTDPLSRLESRHEIERLARRLSSAC